MDLRAFNAIWEAMGIKKNMIIPSLRFSSRKPRDFLCASLPKAAKLAGLGWTTKVPSGDASPGVAYGW